MKNKTVINALVFYSVFKERWAIYQSQVSRQRLRNNILTNIKRLEKDHFKEFLCNIRASDTVFNTPLPISYNNRKVYKFAFLGKIMNSKLENIIKKVGKTAVKAALPVIAAAAFMMPREVKGIGIDGYLDVPSCSVKVWRVNPPDTIRTITNIFCKYGIETNNFNPPSQIGDSLYIQGGWNLGGDARTNHIVKASDNTLLDLNLNKHTACIDNVHDSTHFNSAPLKLIYWIDGFAPETTQVDTGFSWYWYYDVHAPFNKSQATHGAQAHFRFEKVHGDTTFFRNINFTIDTTRFDAQLVKDTIYFTKDSSVIGTSEENKQTKPLEYQVYPTITKGKVNIKGLEKGFDVFNVAGQCIGKYKSNSTGSYEIKGPDGNYFIVPEEKEKGFPVKKVTKIKN